MNSDEGYTLVHAVRMPLRWGDMDAMGHVNNTLYFRYLEQARIEWFEALGCPADPGGVGPVIISAHCTFLKQLRYPGEIEVRTLVGEFGRSSFHTRQRIVREGGAKVVWVDQRVEKSLPLPEAMRERLVKPCF
jgi:acyl-CoA thioester hydrolase